FPLRSVTQRGVKNFHLLPIRRFTHRKTVLTLPVSTAVASGHPAASSRPTPLEIAGIAARQSGDAAKKQPSIAAASFRSSVRSLSGLSAEISGATDTSVPSRRLVWEKRMRPAFMGAGD